MNFKASGNKMLSKNINRIMIAGTNSGCGKIDLFLCGEKKSKYLLAKNSKDFDIIHRRQMSLILLL